MRAGAARRAQGAAATRAGRWTAIATAALVGGLFAGAARGPAPAAPAIAAVRVPTAPLQPDAVATGLALGGGRVLTVAHVLRAGRPVFVAGRRARVLRVDRRLDVAVLAANLRGDVATGAARAGDRATVRVLRSGAAQALPATVRRTITARIGGAARPALELAGAVEPGDSGAPVLDARGRLLGVVFAQAAGPEALVYAVDARALGRLRRP